MATFLEENGLTGKADGSMIWSEAKDLVPLDVYFGGQFEEAKKAYGLDDSITGDMTWGETKDTILAAQEEYVKKMQNATPAPATDAPAETAEADATAAPADGE